MGRGAGQGRPGPDRPRPSSVLRPAARAQVKRGHHPTTDGGLERDRGEDGGGVRNDTDNERRSPVHTRLTTHTRM